MSPVGSLRCVWWCGPLVSDTEEGKFGVSRPQRPETFREVTYQEHGEGTLPGSLEFSSSPDDPDAPPPQYDHRGSLVSCSRPCTIRLALLLISLSAPCSNRRVPRSLQEAEDRAEVHFAFRRGTILRTMMYSAGSPQVGWVGFLRC